MQLTGLSPRRWVVVVMVGLAVVVAGTAGALWSNGYRLYAVRTGSMTPTYLPGDLVVDGPTSATYRVGTVVTFRHGTSPDAVTTHRVHAVTRAGLQTKGDANRSPDPTPVATSQVLGRVVAGVPRGGYLLVFLQQPAGVGATMTLVLSLVLAWRMFFPAPRRPRAGSDTPAGAPS